VTDSLPPPLPDQGRLRQQKNFPCPNCGAELVWDPDADAQVCSHCEFRRPVIQSNATIVERALEDVTGSARGFGTDARVAQCGSCGARVTFDESATSTDCVFCGSPSVLAQEERRNPLRPESLIPLDVGRDTVRAQFRKWTHGMWFRPNALKNVDQFQARGVYVPCWTFDARVHSDWSADSGTYYYVTILVPMTVNGRTTMVPQQVRHVSWTPANGAREDYFDDLLVPASGFVRGDLLKKLGAFDNKALVPYQPEYLAGWHAEEYRVDLADGWKAAQARIEEQQIARCGGDVPGDTHRDLRVANTIRDVRWKHILLPVWTLTYRCNGKPYTVLIHGQTGNVEGDAPISWAKVLGLILMMLLFFLIVAALANF